MESLIFTVPVKLGAVHVTACVVPIVQTIPANGPLTPTVPAGSVVINPDKSVQLPALD
jgi:hypothetical protein